MQRPFTSPALECNEPAGRFRADFSEGAEVGVYLALLELIDEGLIITGDEIIIDANSAACRLLGRSYRQLAGQPLGDLFADEHAFLEARERVLIRGEARGILRLVMPDGRVAGFSYVAAPRLRPGIHAIILGPDRLTASTLPPFGTSTGAGAPVWPMALSFSPRIHARTGALQAVEALPCWQTPGAESWAPPIAPVEIDTWTLTSICRVAATWPRVGEMAPKVSVKIGAQQLKGNDLPFLAKTALAASRLEADRLEFSLSDELLTLPEDEIAPRLQTLADMGVSLALDHFGRNPVPLPQLARYAFDALKLDAQLIEQIGRDDEDTTLIEALINMAVPLGIDVIGRGVASRAQHDFLLALGCELQQGPWIGGALDENAFARYLQAADFC